MSLIDQLGLNIKEGLANDVLHAAGFPVTEEKRQRSESRDKDGE